MAKKVYKPEQKPLYDAQENKKEFQTQEKPKKKKYTQDDVEAISEHNRNAAKKARRGCLIFFLVIVVIAFIAGLVVYNNYKSELNGSHSSLVSEVQFTIDSGSSTTTIAKKLEEENIIGSSSIFKLYTKFMLDESPEFKAGTYTMTNGMSYDEIINVLTANNGGREVVQVQVPEGVSVMRIAEIFEENGLCSSEEFLNEANNLEAFDDLRIIQTLLADPEFNQELVFESSEGFLFPDTYNFYKDDSVSNMVRKLYEEMNAKVTDEMYTRMDELGISLRKTITLASMIQAEAGDVDQQPQVSGVFWNRLSDDWAQGTLGSDVTLRYVKIWLQHNNSEYAEKTYSEISYDEARAAVGESLFYAYVTDDSDSKSHAGLPEGPICSISLTALQAALYPETSNYYYFLTDYYGNYYYAETYQEHLKNVETMKQKNAEYEAENANG